MVTYAGGKISETKIEEAVASLKLINPLGSTIQKAKQIGIFFG